MAQTSGTVQQKHDCGGEAQVDSELTVRATLNLYRECGFSSCFGVGTVLSAPYIRAAPSIQRHLGESHRLFLRSAELNNQTLFNASLAPSNSAGL